MLWKRWTVLLISSIIIAILNLLLNKLGYKRTAAWLFTTMIWVLITLSCYSAGGIMATGILSQTSVILTAGFLLGWQGGLLIGLLTLLIDFGFVYLELTGQLPAPSIIHTPLTRWLSAIIPFATTLVVQYYATNHLRSSLV